MSVRILEGTYDGTQEQACLVDSVTGTAFGPLFDDIEEATAFCAWLRNTSIGPECDPRIYTPRELEDSVSTFRARPILECSICRRRHGRETEHACE